MSAEPDWLTAEIVTAIHAEQIAAFGGANGTRDLAMLQSAIDRPRNKWGYGEQSLTVLAAAYGFGLAKNHPFVDGNKRTALMTMYAFLDINRLVLDTTDVDAVMLMEQLASGDVTEAILAAWIADKAR
jgi:death on curing protein